MCSNSENPYIYHIKHVLGKSISSLNKKSKKSERLQIIFKLNIFHGIFEGLFSTVPIFAQDRGGAEVLDNPVLLKDTPKI